MIGKLSDPVATGHVNAFKKDGDLRIMALFSTLLIVSAYAAAPETASAGQMQPAVAPDLDIEEQSLSALSAALTEGTTTSEIITRSYLERIDQIDRAGPNLHSVIAVMPDALAQARKMDQERQAGNIRGPMHGIPVLLKDNIEASGPVPTTAGSTALLENITNRDAPLVARLKEAGAVILGKTNLSQWANIRSDDSTSGWSSVGGLVKNPHALLYNSCGSSSGSGASVAASLAAAAIGTETDGSVICPSSANGIVGLKPTVGLVSRRHIVPISHSQDTAGPMTRTVRDAAILLTAMAGSDPQDAATAEADSRKGNYADGLSIGGLAGTRIGVLRDRIGDQPGTTERFEQALQVLRDQGALLIDIADSRSGLDGLGDAEFKVLMVELKADMNAYLAGLPPQVESRSLADLIAFNKAHADVELEFFGQDLFELAESQPGLDDPEYLAAKAKARNLAGPMGIDRLLGTYGVALLVAPSLGPAWKSTLGKGDSFDGPSASQLPAISGYPHLTVPAGTVGGLPVGLSFLGPKWSEHLLLKAGYAYEQASQARAVPQYGEEPPAR